MLPAIGAVRPWADPEIVSINRLSMRPPTAAAATLDQARAGTPLPWRRSLDGRWSFRLFDHPDRVPASAVGASASGAAWSKIAVPGNWTVQGVGDLPQYTNVRMPFDGPPPRLPDRNPTGGPSPVAACPVTVDRSSDRRARRRRRQCPRPVHQRRVRGLRHRQPPRERIRRHLVRPARRERRGHRRGSLERAQLRRGSGPVVDGGPAPLGVRRGARRRAPCVAGVRRRAGQHRRRRCHRDRQRGRDTRRERHDRRTGASWPGMGGALRRRDPPRSATHPTPNGRRAVPVRLALPVQRPHGVGVVRGPRDRTVVCRIPDALPRHRRTARRRPPRLGGPHPTRRVPFGRGSRPPATRERRAGLVVRRQPPRPPPHPR